MTIADKILKLMEDKKISKVQLAKSIGMPVTSFRYKLDKNVFTAEDIVKISEVTNIKLDYFNNKEDSFKKNEIQVIFNNNVVCYLKNITNASFKDDWICPIQLKSDTGEGMYVLGADIENDDIYLFLVEDFNMRDDLVFRSRTLNKVYQFMDIAGFNIVEENKITVGELIDNLISKRNMPLSKVISRRHYIQKMCKDWLSELD